MPPWDHLQMQTATFLEKGLDFPQSNCLLLPDWPGEKTEKSKVRCLCAAQTQSKFTGQQVVLDYENIFEHW